MENIIVPLKLCVTVIFCSVLAYSQWISFDLETAVGPDFKKKVNPLIRGTSLALGYHPIYLRNQEQRSRVGFSLSTGIDFTGSSFFAEKIGGLPTLNGMVVLTSNLYLHGKLSGFTSGTDLIQLTAYGVDLFLTEQEQGDWRFRTQLTRLEGPDDIRYRIIDASILKEIKTGKFPLCIGFGINIYTSRITMNVNESHPAVLDGQVNYLVSGTTLTAGSFVLGLQLKIHPETAVITVDVVRSFH